MQSRPIQRLVSMYYKSAAANALTELARSGPAIPQLYRSANSSAAADQRVQSKDSEAPQLADVQRRLEVLERHLHALMSERNQQQQRQQQQQSRDGKDSSQASQDRYHYTQDRTESHHHDFDRPSIPKGERDTVTEKAAGAMEDAAEDAVKQLHPAFTKFINSGYLESQRQLRDRLMQSEWDETVRLWALRMGVAEFEKHVAEKGQENGIQVTWDQMQALYSDPEDLSPLADLPQAQLMAHAFIEKAVMDQQVEVYKTCTDTAKQLANVIESGQRTGATTLLGAIRKLIPLPFLR